MDYDICKKINGYYFDNYGSLSLIMPSFFDEFSEEGVAVMDLKKLIDENQYDQAIALAEEHLQRFPSYTHNAFLTWQIYALWHQGKIPNSELLTYFATLEEVFPKEAYLHFDKAALLIRDKNFNEAVKELKKARAKDANHLQSQVLLFLIYYFSHDDQWHNLFLSLAKNKVLSNDFINIINIVESIKNKKTTPLYLQADKDNIESSNRALFEKFPPLRTYKSPTEENIVFVAADGKYLKEYVTTLLLSALTIKNENFGIHIHLYNPMGTDIDLLKKYDEKYPQLKLSFSFEKGSFFVSSESLAYYASLRFCRAYQILNQFDCIKKIAIADADLLFRKNIFDREDVRNCDISMIYTEMAPDWDKFAGGFSAFSKSDFGLSAFGYLTNILLKNFSTKNEFWFIDQVALFDTYQKFHKENKINRISLNDLFGENMQHTPDAALWTYTNEHKLKDNPMNRERKRLIAQYGISLDWNGMAYAKYGTVIANKNDEYIGRSLLTYGSWCDHEIQILKRLIDFDDTVVEVGSNMGSHTLPLAKLVGDGGKLIAIEPQRLLFQTICANIAVNSLKNVYVLNIGCGEQEGFLNVEELDPAVQQNFGGYQPKAKIGNSKVEIKTIDSLELDDCKLIKMDIEGMELEALKGAKETLKKYEPILFFESHGQSVFEIADFLKNYGYIVYDFAIPNDPMFLAVTKKYEHFPGVLNILPLSA